MFIPKYTPSLTKDLVKCFSIPVVVELIPEPIESFGHHMIGCKVGANAVRLQLVLAIADLSRSLHIDTIVEPLQLFETAHSVK